MHPNFVFFLILTYLLRVGGKISEDLRTPKQIRELKNDLRTSAQFACGKSVQFTAGNFTHVYVDYPVWNKADNVLSGFSAHFNESRVIHSQISAEELARNSRTPVALTGANIGLGVGKSNGTHKAVEFMKQKQMLVPILPQHHVRHNGSLCVSIGRSAELGISSFYESLKHDFKLSHLTILNDVALHNDGIVALECGLLQPRMGCGNRFLSAGRSWRRSISSTIRSNSPLTEKSAWSSMASLSIALGSSLPVHDEVFVISARWDYNFHHFLVESIARLVRFYHYLQRNTHIKIHIRAHEAVSYNASRLITVKRAREGRAMRRRVLELLDISPERIVHGQLLARKLYLPNDMECSSSLRHALELQLLSRLLVQQAEKATKKGTCTPSPQRTFTSHRAAEMRSGPDPDIRYPRVTELPARAAKVIVQARVCKADWRCLDETVAGDVARAAEKAFPNSDVVIANTSLSRGLGCDIALYRDADVVIGVHGAAMTNAMFMRPGSVLVEVIGEYDLRMPPVCGYHGPFAAVFGVHHYVYYYDGLLAGSRLDVNDLLLSAYNFYTSIRTHANYTVHDVAPVSYV